MCGYSIKGNCVSMEVTSPTNDLDVLTRLIDILKCTSKPKMKFVAQGFQELKPEHDRQTHRETDARTNIQAHTDTDRQTCLLYTSPSPRDS